MKTINDIGEFLLSIFFPNRCIFCSQITEVFNDICETCDDTLPWIKGEICRYCGANIDDCSCNGKHGFYYERVISPLYYEGNAKKCIHDFKFRDCRENAKCLSRLMSELCREKYSGINFDYVTYIPMEKKSEKKRGFNQSRLLAQRISKDLSIPFADEMLVKIYKTDNQHDCDGIRRQGNLLGAFDCNEKYRISGKTILLIDDIKTSGSTLSECGKMLYLFGADRVFCLTAALVNSKINTNISQKGSA